PVEADGLEDELTPHRILHDGQRQHGVASNPICGFFTNALQHFLDDWEAGHDVVEWDLCRQIEGAVPAEYLDPDGRIDQCHARPRRRADPWSRSIAPSRPSHAPDPRRSRIRRALACFTNSSSARSTVRE